MHPFSLLLDNSTLIRAEAGYYIVDGSRYVLFLEILESRTPIRLFDQCLTQNPGTRRIIFYHNIVDYILERTLSSLQVPSILRQGELVGLGPREGEHCSYH